MQISIFGNPDLDFDSLSLKILPQLQNKFPDIKFKTQDPNELDFPGQNQWIIIDTVQGINKVQFIDIDKIENHKKRATVHDFDLSAYLKLIRKIKKHIDIKIIGIPMFYNKTQALKQTATLISTLILKNEKHSSYTDHRPE